MVTLDSIVREALISRGEQSLHKYSTFLQHALQAAKDFYMDTGKAVKTVRLPMNDLKQVELPLDFVDWVKVGIVCGDVIKIMGSTDKLPILSERDDCGEIKRYDDSNCGVNEVPVNYLSYGGYSFLNYVNEYGENLGGLYGYGGGYTRDGYFRWVKNEGDNGILQFNSEVNTTDVYIEYITNGFDPKAETKVHEYAKMSIENYIHWKVWSFKDGMASANARGAKEEYYQELHRARKRLLDLTIGDILEISRKEYGQAPKY